MLSWIHWKKGTRGKRVALLTQDMYMDPQFLFSGQMLITSFTNKPKSYRLGWTTWCDHLWPGSLECENTFIKSIWRLELCNSWEPIFIDMIFQLGKKELFLRYENRNKIKEEIIKVVKKMICLLDALVLQLIRLKSLTLGKIIC